jgi:hypothetical protein
MYILKSQTMNKIQFLVCNISAKLSADINEMIFKKVQENAAESIQRMYYLRVRINLDAFLIFRRLSYRNVSTTNKLIDFYARKIRYSFIQEHGTWVETLYDILVEYDNFPFFHANNVYSIINRIQISNPIYAKTGIEWWENF